MRNEFNLIWITFFKCPLLHASPCITHINEGLIPHFNQAKLCTFHQCQPAVQCLLQQRGLHVLLHLHTDCVKIELFLTASSQGCVCVCVLHTLTHESTHESFIGTKKGGHENASKGHYWEIEPFFKKPKYFQVSRSCKARGSHSFMKKTKP